MSTVHGRRTKVTVSAKDISQYCKTSTLERSADVHDNTGYGGDDRTKNGGLRDGKFSCGGTYDNSAVAGPGAALRPLIGQTVPVTRALEGTGTGKPLQTFDAVLAKYVETNPVDDNVSWSAELEVTGPIVETVQP